MEFKATAVPSFYTFEVKVLCFCVPWIKPMQWNERCFLHFANVRAPQLVSLLRILRKGRLLLPRLKNWLPCVCFAFEHVASHHWMIVQVNSVKPKFVTPAPSKPARTSFFGKLGDRVKNVRWIEYASSLTGVSSSFYLQALKEVTSPKPNEPTEIKITGRATDVKLAHILVQHISLSTRTANNLPTRTVNKQHQ